jgi:hypothetical protein
MAKATKTRLKAKAAPKAKSKPKVKAEKGRRADGLLTGSAGAKLVDAICSKAGATHAELRAVVKWKSCLPFAMKSAAQATIKLRKERQEDGQVRYFGTAA